MYGHVVIACLFGLAAGAPSYDYTPIAAVGVDTISAPRYNFNYAVNDPHTGDNKAQHEVRDGGYVKGSYSLSEPDGTLRVVDYTADPMSGFNAVVKRVGPAAHPQPVAPIIAKQIIEPAPIAPSIVTLGYNTGLGYGDIGLGGIGYGYNKLDLGDYGLWKN